MSAEAGVLFEVFGFGVTSHMTTMTGITVLLGGLSYGATRNMKTNPKGLQNFMEMVVEKLEGFLTGVIGAKEARKFIPLLGTFFLFIIVSNYSGLLPGAGHLPGLAAPTSVLGVTIGLAIVTFFSTHFFGFRAHGVRYLKHIFSLNILLSLLMLIDEMVRPVSLSLRLYGNIYGEEMVASQIAHLVPLFLPLPFMALGLLFGAVQALVLMLLSSIYIHGAVGEGH